MTTTPASSLAIGRVTLTVHDLDAVSAYYEKTIGLTRLAGNADTVELGTPDGTVLLVLRRDAKARRRSRGEAGLFHTAFLLPERGDLARWTGHAIASQTQVAGASDHIVSEAIYLTDPEGNGIEIYTDRPRDSWRWQDGLVSMATEALDVPDLIAAAGNRPWTGFPDGSVVGHVHLQVGSIQPAEAFWRDTVGLAVTSHYPGATFFAADGYHHHIATNIWNSRNAPPRDLPSTGLSEVELRVRPDIAEAIAGRAQKPAAGSLALVDPWNTPIRVTAR